MPSRLTSHIRSIALLNARPAAVTCSRPTLWAPQRHTTNKIPACVIVFPIRVTTMSEPEFLRRVNRPDTAPGRLTVRLTVETFDRPNGGELSAPDGRNRNFSMSEVFSEHMRWSVLTVD